MTRPQYQQQQRRNSSQRGHSGTPSHPIQAQRSRSQQLDHNSEHARHTPQTPASAHGSVRQASRKGSLITPDGKLDNKSKDSSQASTPYGRNGPGDDLSLDSSNTAPTPSASQNFDPQKPEDGEVGDVEDEEALFNWEFKQIFNEPARDETVALAQPLSANFKSTPVPLVQAWSMSVPSISRYARKENQKEFIRPIRELPQWSYLQEDPAFADIQSDGRSIPLEELPSWIITHHEQMDMQTDDETMDESLQEPVDEQAGFPRKRRSDEVAGSSQDYSSQKTGDIKNEDSSDQEDGTPRVKRLKTVNEKDEDEMMQTPTVRTPVIGYRSGTPCVETEGDAWAPEPGETASAPQNPTEALLASLGVTGSPKPVKKEPVPAYMNDLEEQPHRSQSSQPLAESSQDTNPPPNPPPVHAPQANSHAPPKVKHSHPPKNQPGPPINLNGQSAPPTNMNNNQGPPPMAGHNQQGPPANNQHEYHPPNAQQYGAPMNGPYVNGQQAAPSYNNSPAGNFPPGNQQYGYQNGPPNQSITPYAPPANVPPPFVNAPPQPNNYGPPNNFPQQGPPSWGPQNQPYNHVSDEQPLCMPSDRLRYCERVLT